MKTLTGRQLFNLANDNTPADKRIRETFHLLPADIQQHWNEYADNLNNYYNDITDGRRLFDIFQQEHADTQQFNGKLPQFDDIGAVLRNVWENTAREFIEQITTPKVKP